MDDTSDFVPSDSFVGQQVIICIVGKKRNGKNTAADIIQSKYRYIKQEALASGIKKIAANILGISMEKLETLKDDEEFILVHNSVTEKEVTMRTFLQYLGQLVKEVCGIKVWLNDLLSRLNDDDSYLITDLRFPYEADSIKEWASKRGIKTIIIKIERPSIKNDDDHESEMFIDDIAADVVVVNDGTVEDLRTKLLSRVELCMQTC